MRPEKDTRLYNLLLPLWLLLFFPSWLWLLLIPANYILDRLVLRWSLGDRADRGLFCRRHTWKICLAGFFADAVGGALMLALLFLPALLGGDSAGTWLDDLLYGIGFNPFSHPLALLLVLLCIAVSGAVIFLLDQLLLSRAGLDAAQARRSALRLAVITAPYLFLFPSSLLYESGLFGL